MKELSIEEKAKAYDEAIERAKGAHNGAKSDKKNGVTDKITEYTIQLTETIFPSLKESEDERMRNAAINACKYMVDNFENSTKQYEDAIAWLEKQCEQKPAWSEEDERTYKVVLELIDSYSKGTIGGCIIPPNVGRYAKWFKALKDRVRPTEHLEAK